MEIKLELPHFKYKNSFREGLRQYEADGYEFGIKLSEVESHDGLLKHIDDLEGRRRGVNLPAGYVPDTKLWIIKDGVFVGSVGIRHELNEHLKTFGGHIGYAIVPEYRGKGYGTKCLELALDYARENLGLEEILITCYESNIASKKIIISNGGVLKDKSQIKGHPDVTCRFIIS